MLLALKTEEGTTAKNCGWTLKAGKGKEMNFCWSFQKKKTWPLQYLDFSPVRPELDFYRDVDNKFMLFKLLIVC